MTRARDIADLVDANGDIVVGALDNVPASNDASALTTGTLAGARLPSSVFDASTLTTGTLDSARLPSSVSDASSLTTGTLPDGRFPATLPAVSGANLTGIVSFAAGTLMLFQQTAAPSGWTKQTTHNDKALRVVTGTVGSGGSSGFTTAFGTPTVTGTIAGSTGSHTLTTAEMPSHTHTVNNHMAGYPWAGGHQNAVGDAGNGGYLYGASTSSSTGGGGSHSHSLSASFSGGAAAINVEYVDLIIASKD